MIHSHNTMFGAVTQILADTGALALPHTVAPVSLTEAHACIKELIKFTHSEAQIMGELVTHIEQDGNHTVYKVDRGAGYTLGYVWVWTLSSGSIDRVYAYVIVGG